MFMVEIELKINNRSENENFFIEFEENKEFISIYDIESKFYEKIIEELGNPEKDDYRIDFDDISQKDIEYEYIRYYETEIDAWILLNDNKKLKLDKEQNIKLKIKINIETQKEKMIRTKIARINKQIDNISNDFINKYLKENKIENNDSKIDIVVLTANPLINVKEQEEIELRTMNDFNKITNSIYETIIKSNKFILAEFLPLTLQNLYSVILKKPKIIHLICKSAYMYSNDDKIKTAYLLFETQDYYKMEPINKKHLDPFFGLEENKKEKSENEHKINKKLEEIKDIFLIISTQLSEDVFNMVKDYKFKDILVQHTTLADTFFIAEFNKQFYTNIIDNYKIEDCFNDAKSISTKKIKLNQFCCCFHHHEQNCQFMKNCENELYYKYEKDEDIPHFLHLRYYCECKKPFFCIHKKNCINYRKPKKNNCCGDRKGHILDNIFFSNEFSNNILLRRDGDGFPIIKNTHSNYDKMNLIIGKNKIIYDVYKNLFKENINIINIYNKENKFIELSELADIIIEYFRERINLQFYEEEEENSSDDLDNEIYKTKSFDYLNNINVDLQLKRKLKSYSISKITNMNKYHYDFKKIILIAKDQLKINRMINKGNIIIIYLIIVSGKDLINDNKISELYNSNLKIIFLTYDEEYKNMFENFKKNNPKHKIENLYIEEKRQIDYKIRYQFKKISMQKEEFENYIKEKKIQNRDKPEIPENIKPDIKDNFYEILFLFYCIKRKLYDLELEILYKDKYQDLEKIIENELKMKIIKIEKYKNYKEYIKIDSNDYFNKFYNNWKNEITSDIKGRVLLNLFGYYSTVFRYLIKLLKQRCLFDKNIFYFKKFKPVETLTSFSALNEFGIWTQYNDNKEDISMNSFVKLTKYIFPETNPTTLNNFFFHCINTFEQIFTLDNILICLNNDNIKDKVIKYIGDLSLTCYTIPKIFDIKNYKTIDRIISNFKEIFETEKKEFLFSSIRFNLMYYINNNNNKTINELNKIKEEFKKNNNLKGELETIFAIFNLKLKDDKINIKEEFNQSIEKLGKIEGNENIIKIYKCKFGYAFAKNNIKRGIQDKTDLEILEENVKILKNENKNFFRMKNILLIGKWYSLGNQNGNIDLDLNFCDFLNFALYLYSSNHPYQNYLINYAEVKNKYKTKIKDLEDKIYLTIEEKLKKINQMYENNEFTKEKVKNIEFYIP